MRRAKAPIRTKPPRLRLRWIRQERDDVAVITSEIHSGRCTGQASPIYALRRFFEDINRTGDGGLYAQMLQNRSFEDNSRLIAWTPLLPSAAVASFDLDKSQPLNADNATSLKIDIEKPGSYSVSHWLSKIPLSGVACNKNVF